MSQTGREQERKGEGWDALGASVRRRAIPHIHSAVMLLGGEGGGGGKEEKKDGRI